MALLPAQTNNMLARVKKSLDAQKLKYIHLRHASTGRIVYKNISDLLILSKYKTDFITLRKGETSIKFSEIEKQYEMNISLYDELKDAGMLNGREFGFVLGFGKGNSIDNLYYLNMDAVKKIKESELKSINSEYIKGLMVECEESVMIKEVNLLNKTYYNFAELLGIGE